jgi:hypothetical protein
VACFGGREAAIREAREEYPSGGGESPSPAADLEARNLFPLKGSALFFASFFKEKKEDRCKVGGVVSNGFEKIKGVK